MQRLRLLMAVSKDGFVCRNSDDPMTWTSPDDKRVFRLLTSVGGIVAAGSRTTELLPHLPGREVICLSTKKKWASTLEQFWKDHPSGWLIGGQTVALAALGADMVGEVFMCRSEVSLYRGVPDDITPYLKWRRVFNRIPPPVDFPGVHVDIWRRV